MIPSDAEIQEKVLNIISEKLTLSREKIALESTPESLGMDSLDIVEIVMAIEDEFDMEISDETVDTFKTVKDIIGYVQKNS